MQFGSLKNSQKFIERLWDLWCVASIVGIWPRFIEPRLLLSSHTTIPIPDLAKEFEGLKIVQISDLHFTDEMSDSFLDRIAERIKAIGPDLIFFTGDLITYSELKDAERLKSFLKTLQAPLGSFAILGNHDYADYVSLASDGRFRKIESHLPAVVRGFSRLFSADNPKEEGAIVRSPIAQKLELSALYSDAGIRLLHNETVQVGKKNALLNISGLGDFMTGNCFPQEAFKNYIYSAPGIVLSHNPDSYDLLENYPGDLMLFGHTHGGQVNLPFIWKKVTPLKNKVLKSGLFHLDSRYLYVNRGLGQTFPFRWFAPPEVAVIELVREGPVKASIWDKLLPEDRAQEPVCGT